MYSIIDIIRLPFRKERELFSALYSILGFYPHDITLYKTALAHRSIRKRMPKGVDNERLEFLGDAILDAIVADVLYEHFPNKKEGFLTDARSKIVKRESLGKLAKEMGLISLIRNANSNQSHNSYMGGNALEALIGAVYLDKGYNFCMKFIKRRILDSLINIDKVAYKEVNFKSKLIEWAQKNRIDLEYRLAEEQKDENSNSVFIYTVYLEGIESGHGKGYTKKESQQKASKEALTHLRKDVNFMDEIFAEKSKRTQMEEAPVFGVPKFT